MLVWGRPNSRSLAQDDATKSFSSGHLITLKGPKIYFSFFSYSDAEFCSAFHAADPETKFALFLKT